MPIFSLFKWRDAINQLVDTINRHRTIARNGFCLQAHFFTLSAFSRQKLRMRYRMSVIYRTAGNSPTTKRKL